LKECNKLKKRAAISGGETGITGSRVPLEGIIIAMDDLPKRKRAEGKRKINKKGIFRKNLFNNNRF
jgi:D-lactate dehydrogenase (cytochrome)